LAREFLIPLNSNWVEAQEKTVEPSSLGTHWIGWYKGFLGLGYNSDLISEEELHRGGEDTWEELLETLSGRGKLLISPNPSRSSAGLVLASGIINLNRMGADSSTSLGAGRDFLEKLFDMTCCYPKGGNPAIEMLKTGKVIAAIDWAHDLRREIAAQRLTKVKVFVPTQTPWEIGAASILKVSKNVKLAEEFLEFLLSDEVAELNMKEGRRYSTLLKNAETTPPDMEDWDELPVLKQMPCREQIPPYNEVLDLAIAAMPFQEFQGCDPNDSQCSSP
jgi:ABC-type Fe3+ transport system substrate-binding protein